MSKQKNQRSIIQPDERVCKNCTHMLWMVGIGQGVRCTENRVDGFPQIIPHLKHSCKCFKFSHEISEQDILRDWSRLIGTVQKKLNSLPQEKKSDFRQLLEEQEKLRDIWKTKFQSG